MEIGRGRAPVHMMKDIFKGTPFPGRDQKSSVTPSATTSSTTRSGQSAEDMSQNPHSRWLGTRRVGSLALGAIDGVQEAGGSVYLHCREGVGCTGTVVGCRLVRQTGTGDRPWGRSGSSAGSSQVIAQPQPPETEEQREYVRDREEGDPSKTSD